MIDDLPAKFKTLANKLKRQKIALSKINDNYNELQNVMRTGSLAPIHHETIAKNNKKIARPIYCYDNHNKKGDCFEKCNTTCNYSILQLESEAKTLPSSEILMELQKHRHPITRKINNIWRTNKEAIQELLNHYKYSHPI